MASTVSLMDPNHLLDERKLLHTVFAREERDGGIFYVYKYDQRYYKILSACAKLRLKTKNLPEGNPTYIEVKFSDWAAVVGESLPDGSAPVQPASTHNSGTSIARFASVVPAAAEVIEETEEEKDNSPIVPAEPISNADDIAQAVEALAATAPATLYEPRAETATAPLGDINDKQARSQRIREQSFKSREEALFTREEAVKIREDAVKDRENGILDGEEEIVALEKSLIEKEANLNNLEAELQQLQQHLDTEAAQLLRQKQEIQKLAGHLQRFSETLMG
jgi:hypothetical protein